MSQNNASLKSEWTNSIIASAITILVGVAARYAMWYIKIWQDADTFTDEFATNSIILLCVTVLIPVIMFLISYKRYVDLIANNPHKIHLIAKDDKFWVVCLILTPVLEIVWNVVCFVVLSIACSLAPLAVPDDRAVIAAFLAINGIAAVIDLLLFLVNNAFFQPKSIIGYRK